MPQDLLQIALEHHRSGRLQQAAAGYRAVLEAEPGHAEANQWLGILVLQAGRADQAVAWLERAATARPEDAAFQHNLAQAYLGCGRYDEAIAALERSAALDPNRPETMMALGLARLSRQAPGDAEVAVSVLRLAQASGLDSAELHHHLAVALLSSSRFEEA